MSGWICPKCNKVYGPSVEQCRMCNLLNEVPKKPQYTNFRREFGRCMKSLRADFDKAAEEMHAYDLTDTPKRAEPHPASPEPTCDNRQPHRKHRAGTAHGWCPGVESEERCAYVFPVTPDRNIPAEARGQVCGERRLYPWTYSCKRFGVYHDFTAPEPKALDLADERSPLPTDSQEFIDGFNAGFRRAKKIAERLRTKATTEEGSQE